MERSTWVKRSKKELAKLSRGREKYPRAQKPWMYVAAEKYFLSLAHIKIAYKKYGLWYLKTMFRDVMFKREHGIAPASVIIRVPGFVGTITMLSNQTGYKTSTMTKKLTDYRKGRVTLDELLRARTKWDYSYRTGREAFLVTGLAPRKEPEEIQLGKFEKQWLDSHEDTRDYEEIKRNDSFIKREDRPKQNLGVEPHRANLPAGGISFSL